MNKTDFIVKLSEELDTIKVEAIKTFNISTKCIAHVIKDDNELKFIGFGTFKANNKEETEVRTPKGTMEKVAAQRKVSFSVVSEFKAIVNEK